MDLFHGLPHCLGHSEVKVKPSENSERAVAPKRARLLRSGEEGKNRKGGGKRRKRKLGANAEKEKENAEKMKEIGTEKRKK